MVFSNAEGRRYSSVHGSPRPAAGNSLKSAGFCLASAKYCVLISSRIPLFSKLSIGHSVRSNDQGRIIWSDFLVCASVFGFWQLCLSRWHARALAKNLLAPPRNRPLHRTMVWGCRSLNRIRI
jgi:hypothetical protein